MIYDVTKLFCRKQQNYHDLKNRVNYQELQENSYTFSKIKLFRQRDNIGVSRKNWQRKTSNSISLWALNSKYLKIDFTNYIIFFWVLWLAATLIIFCHYIEDGFMLNLTSQANLPNIISNLYTSYISATNTYHFHVKSRYHSLPGSLLVTQPFHHQIPYSPLPDLPETTP